MSTNAENLRGWAIHDCYLAVLDVVPEGLNDRDLAIYMQAREEAAAALVDLVPGAKSFTRPKTRP